MIKAYIELVNPSSQIMNKTGEKNAQHIDPQNSNFKKVKLLIRFDLIKRIQTIE